MNDINDLSVHGTENIRAIMENYKEVRNRLRRPPNAVPDTGINLKRQKPPLSSEPPPIQIEPPRIEPSLPDLPLFVPFRRTDLTFSSTLQFAAKEFNISGQQIRSRSRIQQISLPRQVAIYLAAKNHLQSLAGMGRYLKMDHTTMIHAKQRITSLMASDDSLRGRVLALEAKILAAFDRIAVPAQHEPHLAGQENGGCLPIPAISSVDKTGGPNLPDSETD